MPPWFLACQALLVLSLVCSILARLAAIPPLLQAPRTVTLRSRCSTNSCIADLHSVPLCRFGYQILVTSAGADLAASVMLVLTCLVFGLSCWDRTWLLYPNWNYLSWSV